MMYMQPFHYTYAPWIPMLKELDCSSRTQAAEGLSCHSTKHKEIHALILSTRQLGETMMFSLWHHLSQSEVVYDRTIP